MRKALDRAAVSTVIATTILTSTMLLVVAATYFTVSHVLDYVMEDALFDQTVNVMVSVDEIMKDIMFDPGSSGTVKTSFQSNRPNFLEMGNMTVSVNRTSAATGGYITATGGYMMIGDGSPDWGSVTGTVSFWMKWQNIAGRPWGQHDNMELRFSGSNLRLDWGAADSLVSSTSFSVDKWYFLAIVWNENTNELFLYVGDRENPPTLDAYRNDWASTVSDEGVIENNFLASKGGVDPTDGDGDDLRYWDIDRSWSDIESDYDVALSGSESNLRSCFKLEGDFDDIGPDNNDGQGVGSYSFNYHGPSVTPLFSFPVYSFRIRGGRSVGVTTSRDLVGKEALVHLNLSGSLSHVYTYQLGGAWVALDYGRIRCINSGVMKFYNGTGIEDYNVLEITAVRLAPGTVRIREESSLVAKNLGMDIGQVEIRGDPSIIVEFSDSEDEVYLTELGGNSDYPTLINLVVINIEVSVLGGT